MKHNRGATKLAAVATITLSWLSTISCTLQVQPVPTATAQPVLAPSVAVVQSEFAKLYPDRSWSASTSLDGLAVNFVSVIAARRQDAGESPLTLAALIPNDPGPIQWYPLPPAYRGSELVMTTLFDYVAATYGKERLVLLVQSLHEHVIWSNATTFLAA